MVNISFFLYQVVRLDLLNSGVVESKPDLPGGSRPSAEAAAEGRQGKNAPDRAGPAATDPNPPRQRKLVPRDGRDVRSHDTLRFPIDADAQQANNGEHMEVCSPAHQPLAAKAPAPELGSGEPVAAPQLCLSATSEGFSGEQAGPKQRRRYNAWQRPGAKTGLPFFGHTDRPFKAGGPLLKALRDRIIAEGREHLLALLEGWLAFRDDSPSANVYYRVPEEGDIRSTVNAIKYLIASARHNAGEEPLQGVQHTCNPHHAYFIVGRFSRNRAFLPSHQGAWLHACLHAKLLLILLKQCLQSRPLYHFCHFS